MGHLTMAGVFINFNAMYVQVLEQENRVAKAKSNKNHSNQPISMYGVVTKAIEKKLNEVEGSEL